LISLEILFQKNRLNLDRARSTKENQAFLVLVFIGNKRVDKPGTGGSCL
jgi:hypothetical protein